MDISNDNDNDNETYYRELKTMLSNNPIHSIVCDFSNSNLTHTQKNNRVNVNLDHILKCIHSKHINRVDK